jgi:hypothetical protein
LVTIPGGTVQALGMGRGCDDVIRVVVVDDSHG